MSASTPHPTDHTKTSATTWRPDSIWLALLALMILAALSTEGFATLTNLLNILRQVTIVGIAAIGMTIVLLGGKFDLSIGAIITLAAVVSLSLQPVTGVSTGLAILMPLLIGALAGAINGAMVGGLKVNSIIATIGSQFVITGSVLIAVGGAHVRVDDATPLFEALANGSSLGIPHPVYWLLLITAAAHFLSTRTVYGRHLTAIGGNETAARLAGIRTAYVTVGSFVLSGVLAAVSGVLMASRVRNLDPTQGIGYEFQALTAVVLGGARLTGGQANVTNTLAAVLMLGVAANLMVLHDLSVGAQLMAQGMLLIGAVAWHSYSRGRQ